MSDYWMYGGAEETFERQVLASAKVPTAIKREDSLPPLVRAEHFTRLQYTLQKK